MREIFGHVIHPVQIAANTVKKSAQHNGEKITKDEFVFLVKKAGDAKLGITGFFYKKNKFILGYFFAIMLRGLFHSIGGYLYWMDYMPENFPQSLAVLYPVIYNYSYILLEGIITIIALKIPAVNKMFKRLQTFVTSDSP